ncbi:metallophosphoesterase [Verrucomicrobiales bacterium BCK34]|nr:metallophosphoesterase [Verrucomicrobiales bacterium BCK34]
MKLKELSITISVLLFAMITTKINGGELGAAPDGSFTIIVIPDTQHYLGTGTKMTPHSKEPLTNPVFDRWTDWIVENLDRQRIAFVSHVGDIVDKNNPEQWALAGAMMDKLHGRIPYGISVGNHDMKSSGDSSLFQKTFPKSRFAGFDWYAGCFEKPEDFTAISGNNANSFQLFEAEKVKFVFLHLECNAPDDVLAWADSILEKHQDRHAIVTTHMDLGPREKPKTNDEFFSLPKGRMLWKKVHGARGNTSQEMWNKCFSKHKNLFMICSGDQSRTQAFRLKSKGVHGNTVHALVSDYGEDGLRAMRFIPADNLIEVRTWDPIKAKLCESTKVVPDRNQHQFTLNFLMTP